MLDAVRVFVACYLCLCQQQAAEAVCFVVVCLLFVCWQFIRVTWYRFI